MLQKNVNSLVAKKMLDGLLEASPNHSMEFVEGVLNDYILVYADDKNVLFFPVFASAWSNTFTIIEWVDDQHYF